MRATISLEFSSFFQISQPTSASQLSLWEAHKHFIRGIFIAQESKWKKQQSEQFMTLLNQIRSVETLHKCSPMRSTFVESQTFHEKLGTLLSSKIKAELTKLTTHYEWGNKPGKNSGQGSLEDSALVACAPY